MSIDLVNSGDGWFNRAGAFAGEFNRVAALYGSATDTGFQSIWSLFATSEQAAVTALPDAVAAFRTTGTAYQAVLSAEAQAASVLQANRDFPLNPYDFNTSLDRVVAQMVDTAQSINRPTLTSTVTADGDNLGDTEVFVSTTNIYGDPLDMTFAETMTATVTQQGSGYSASVQVLGEPALLPGSWEWPGGSGASAALQVLNPAATGLLSNGALSTFTVSNTPDSWTIVNGNAGVTVFKATSGGPRTGTDAVYLQSDGSQATQLAQAVSLQTNTVYAVTVQAKMNTGSAAGNLVIQLYDPDAGAVIQNDAGSNLSRTVTINGGAGNVGTSYAIFTAFFSTPRQLPSTVQVRIGYGTAGTSTRQLYLALCQIVAATPLYGPAGTGTAGPFAVAVANTLPSAVGDFYEIEFTNSLSTRSFVWGLERLHGMRARGKYVPSAGSPTISDSLVTH